jgi:hypothetical protein
MAGNSSKNGLACSTVFALSQPEILQTNIKEGKWRLTGQPSESRSDYWEFKPRFPAQEEIDYREHHSEAINEAAKLFGLWYNQELEAVTRESSRRSSKGKTSTKELEEAALQRVKQRPLKSDMYSQHPPFEDMQVDFEAPSLSQKAVTMMSGPFKRSRGRP